MNKVHINITEDLRHPPAHEIVLDYLRAYVGSGVKNAFGLPLSKNECIALKEKRSEFETAFSTCFDKGLLASQENIFDTTPKFSVEEKDSKTLYLTYISADRVKVTCEWAISKGIGSIKKENFTGRCTMQPYEKIKVYALLEDIEKRNQTIKECEEKGIPREALEFMLVDTEQVKSLKCYCGCHMEKDFNKRGWVCPNCDNFSEFREIEVPRVQLTMETGFFK